MIPKSHRRKPFRACLHATAATAVALLCIPLGPACSPAPQAAGELTLHCGAGIQPAAKALIAAFEAKTNVKVNANYAGSGRLLGQIASLSKGDLFMPGAELYVDLAIEKGLAEAETKRVAAYFVPVIFVQKGNPKNVRDLTDLARPGLRVGLGDERACAIGRASLLLLEKNRIKRHAVIGNVVLRSGTVVELALHVRLGQLDATIVWDANARQFADHGHAVAIPPARNLPSVIPIVRLKASQNPKAAEDFIRFVTSPEGKAILRREGYTVQLSQETKP